MNPWKHSKTFGEYYESELGEKLEKVAVPVNQLDLVFDVQREDSLEGETREGRGNAVRVSVKDLTPIYKDFKFLRHNDNKTELFSLIADKVPKFTQNISIAVVCTKPSDVTSNSKNDLSPFLPCTHKEADTKIFVYLSHAGQSGIKRALIQTVGNDVVVIALAHFSDLEIDKLLVEFGAGKKKRLLQIHVYAQHLGKLKCPALLFWYPFTGCDTVSSFNGGRKKNCLEFVGSIP